MSFKIPVKDSKSGLRQELGKEVSMSGADGALGEGDDGILRGP